MSPQRVVRGDANAGSSRRAGERVAVRSPPLARQRRQQIDAGEPFERLRDRQPLGLGERIGRRGRER